MVVNDNDFMAVNDFEDLPLIPYQIAVTLLENESEQADNFWKLLCYSEIDALDKDSLTEDQKYEAIWQNDSLENNYHVFFKPLIGSALDTGTAQTQIRMYESVDNPIDVFTDIVNFEIDFITNEKESMVRYKGMLVERTSLMKSLFLSIMNGRDLGLGSGVLLYDKNLTRGCSTTLGINNSKAFYGRSTIMGLKFVGGKTDNNSCG